MWKGTKPSNLRSTITNMELHNLKSGAPHVELCGYIIELWYSAILGFCPHKTKNIFSRLSFLTFVFSCTCKSIWKIHSVSGHSRSPFTSCRTRQSWQWILTGPARVEWLWVNDFSHNEYHIWQAWPSTCWHVGNKLPKYEVPVFIAQTRNHWRKWKGCASVPKNGLPNWCD